MNTLVIKFGGTSVKYGYNHIIDIINNEMNKWDNIVIVVSALSQITNMLLKGIDLSLQKKEYTDIISEILNIHLDMIIDATIIESVKSMILEIQELYKHIQSSGIITNKTKDKISSYGELMSSMVISDILEHNNISHYTITSNNFISTNDNYTNALVDIEKSTKLIDTKVIPMLSSHKIILTTGFLGSTNNGYITTLGRGGSDYSATLIASLLNATEVWIMSDVDGILSADPKKVELAKLLPEIDIIEVAELSFFGAKILHPRTVQPLIGKHIPLRVRNTFKKEHLGTLIQSNIITQTDIIAVTSISNNSLITIEGKGLMGRVGIASRIFNVVSHHNVSIPFITQASSETSICFAIPTIYSETIILDIKKELKPEILSDNIQDIKELTNISLITIIGNNMKNKPGIAGKIFSLLGNNDINIIAISQGSNEISISILIDNNKETEALNIIHSLIK